MRTSRGANSVSVAAVLAAFFLRGVGDALGTPSQDGLHMTSAWPSWLSPIGWAQHVDAFGDNRLAPLGLHLALFAVTIAAVFALQTRRDLGASLLAGRPGRTTASRSLSSSFGLAWRLQTPSIIGWVMGGLACGLFAGSLSSLVEKAADSSPSVTTALQSIAGSGTSIDQALISVMFSIAGLLAAASAIQAVMRMRQEESAGTAELILASPVSRVRWFVDYLAVGAVAIAAVLLPAATLSAICVVASGADASLAGDSFAAAAAQLPAALVFLGLLALVFTLLPAITTGLGWGLLGVLGFIGIFGPLLDLPDGVTHLSPFANAPVLFSDEVDLTGAIWMLVIAAASIALATVVMRGRALRST
jgi:ABC-2 type transport system permease protein